MHPKILSDQRAPAHTAAVFFLVDLQTSLNFGEEHWFPHTITTVLECLRVQSCHLVTQEVSFSSVLRHCCSPGPDLQTLAGAECAQDLWVTSACSPQYYCIFHCYCAILSH